MTVEGPWPTAGQVHEPEHQVLGRLAEATERVGPLAAAREVFAEPAPRPAPVVPLVPVVPAPRAPADPLLVPRTIAGQRALIAARSRRKRRHALLLTRWWAR